MVWQVTCEKYVDEMEEEANIFTYTILVFVATGEIKLIYINIPTCIVQ